MFKPQSAQLAYEATNALKSLEAPDYVMETVMDFLTTYVLAEEATYEHYARLLGQWDDDAN